MSRIVVHEPRQSHEDYESILAGQGHDLVVCEDRESLFAAIAEKRPDLFVYVLGDLLMDLPVLSVIRRVAPQIPLILLGGPAGLEARRSVQELKPTYYGVFPLDPMELADAARSALHHRRAAAS
jgi:DNA-binding NtrC family response regulator